MLLDFSKNISIENLIPATSFEKKVTNFLQTWYASSPTVSVQTSGSTGTPKIFDIQKEKMRQSARMTCSFLKLQPEDTALLCLPVEYISGKMMIVRAIERNLKLLIADPSVDPLKNLNQEISFCALTPLQTEHSLGKLPLIKNLIIGGAAVSESLKKMIFQTLKSSDQKIYETYGMSETLSHIALKEIYPESQEYFTVFEGIQISTDAQNCLKISAPQLNNQLLQTHDIVEIRNKNQFRFLGRADHVINSGGAKIFPESIEAFIKKNIPNEVVALGIPDESLGEKLILIVESPEIPELTEKILNLPFEKSFHKPKAVYFSEKLDRTPNGKIDRLKIRQKFL